MDKHPRCLAKLTNSGFADIVGFGDGGVWTALSNGDGTFKPPKTQPSVATRRHAQHQKQEVSRKRAAFGERIRRIA